MKKITLLILFFFLNSCAVSEFLFNEDILWLRTIENVKLVDQDSKIVPNVHPIKISPDRVQGAFRLILVRYNQKMVQLFSEDKLYVVSQAISEGLRKAKPDQDIVFTLEDWYKGKYTKDNKVTSGRVFYNKDGLNIIFGSILRKGLMNESDPMVAAVNEDLRINPYVPGSRKISIKNKFFLAAPPKSGVFRPRNAKGRVDWLVFTNKALRARAMLGNEEKRISQRSKIEVQSLSSEVKQLRKEIENLRRNPNQVNRSSNREYQSNKYRTQNYNTGSKNNLEIKALKNLRSKGIISEKEYRERLRQLGY